jgi:hypothetical protein
LVPRLHRLLVIAESTDALLGNEDRHDRGSTIVTSEAAR